MNVVFLSPVYPPEMIEYTRGLAEIGANVYGVGDTPFEALPQKVRPYLADYLRHLKAFTASASSCGCPGTSVHS